MPKSATRRENRQNWRFVNNHFYDQDYQAKWTEDGYQSLRAFLGKIAVGQPKIYRAPFAKRDGVYEPMGKVLNDWQAELVSIRDSWPSLWDFEIDLAKKVGPMSVELPLEQRLGDIRHYYEDILLSSKPIDDRAIRRTCDEWSHVFGLGVRSQRATLERMKKSKNSGNPWFTKKRNVLQEIIPCTVSTSYGIEIRHNDVFGEIQGHDWGFCATVGWRGQEGGPSSKDVKQRVVWMFPFAVNLCELQVYQPLIEVAQSRNIVPAWVSMNAVDKEITELFDTKRDDDPVVCTDFSKFDQHFNSDLSGCARDILSHILDHRSGASWLKNIFPAKYSIPLAWSYVDDEYGHRVSYLQGLHGMASGSGGTNVDETLTHRALQHEAAILHGEELNPHSMCLGDDGILSYPGITVDDVVDTYESHGQECNLSKQYVSTQDCVYLRRWHHRDYREGGICVGVYSTCRALGRLRYLERRMDPEIWSPELVALRQLSILENCKFHPLFEQFIEFCMKRDKYRLGIDIPGFLDNIQKLAKEATENMDDFLGYTKTLQGEGAQGISQWRVVKYLRSKS